MSNPVPPAAAGPQPTSIDPSGVGTSRGGRETVLDLLSTAAATTTAGITGVHHLGGVAARTLDRAQRQLLGTSSTPGVTVSQDAGTTTIDLDVVAEYPHPLAAVVDDIRVQVARAAGLIVDGPVAVNIVIADVHGPFDSDPAVVDAIDEGGARAAARRDRVADLIAEARADAVDDAARALDTAAADRERLRVEADPEAKVSGE